MLRILIYLMLIIMGYFLVKKVGKSIFGSGDDRDEVRSSVPADAELIQDPQCGRYFMRQSGVKGIVQGKVIHFCSEECYEKYNKRRMRH